MVLIHPQTQSSVRDPHHHPTSDLIHPWIQGSLSSNSSIRLGVLIGPE